VGRPLRARGHPRGAAGWRPRRKAQPAQTGVSRLSATATNTSAAAMPLCDGGRPVLVRRSSTSIVPPQARQRPGRAGAVDPSLERPQRRNACEKHARRAPFGRPRMADGSARTSRRFRMPHVPQRAADLDLSAPHSAQTWLIRRTGTAGGGRSGAPSLIICSIAAASSSGSTAMPAIRQFLSWSRSAPATTTHVPVLTEWRDFAARNVQHAFCEGAVVQFLRTTDSIQAVPPRQRNG
jgi:hypothetical protein